MAPTTKKDTLIVSYLNIRGQTGIPVEKQLQIEEFLKGEDYSAFIKCPSTRFLFHRRNKNLVDGIKI